MVVKRSLDTGWNIDNMERVHGKNAIKSVSRIDSIQWEAYWRLQNTNSEFLPKMRLESADLVEYL